MAFLLLNLALGDRPAALISVISLAANATPTDPVAVLVNYGALGIFIVLVATGQFRTKYEVQRLEKQVERLVNELASSHELIRAFQMQLTGHTLPALAQSAQALQAIPESELAAQLKKLGEQIEALNKGEKP